MENFRQLEQQRQANRALQKMQDAGARQKRSPR